MMVPLAQNNQTAFKVPASVCIAQAALETGWGRYVVGNNYFGIKAVSNASPENTTGTMEFMGGKWICVQAQFSAYPSIQECIRQYGVFLQNPRYLKCFTAQSAQAFCLELQLCGYATDPSYGEKLITIINQFNLTQYDLSTTIPSTDATKLC